jgi:hypothetical protein
MTLMALFSMLSRRPNAEQCAANQREADALANAPGMGAFQSKLQDTLSQEC